ncbi:hypothetical protein QF032_000057 [Streptomyces achromogenes]|nr:hypothetical protein [Streptomyces achromogenes]
MARATDIHEVTSGFALIVSAMRALDQTAGGLAGGSHPPDQLLA